MLAFAVAALAYWGAGLLVGAGSQVRQAALFGVLMATFWAALDFWKASRGPG